MEFDEYLQMRITQCALMNSLNEKTKLLENIEKKIEENLLKIGSLDNREKRAKILNEKHDQYLSDVLMTIYQARVQCERFPKEDKKEIDRLVEKYKIYDTTGLFDTKEIS